MKTLSALVLLALICFLHRSSAGPFAVVFFSEVECCQNYTQIQIPIPRVKHVARTPTSCTIRAIVVTTVCDQKYCIDPKTRWAKKLFREFQKFTANKKSPHAPFNRIKCNKL